MLDDDVAEPSTGEEPERGPSAVTGGCEGVSEQVESREAGEEVARGTSPLRNMDTDSSHREDERAESPSPGHPAPDVHSSGEGREEGEAKEGEATRDTDTSSPPVIMDKDSGPMSDRGSFRARHSEEPRSPPNVTVVQPSVSHPMAMLPYLYHTAGMYSALSHSMAPHLAGHMFQPGGDMPGLQYLPGAGLPPELSSIAAASGLTALGHSMFLNSQLQQALQSAAHPRLQQAYAASSMASPGSGDPPSVLHGTGRSAHHRFSPYSMPIPKPTPASSSPVSPPIHRHSDSRGSPSGGSMSRGCHSGTLPSHTLSRPDRDRSTSPTSPPLISHRPYRTSPSTVTPRHHAGVSHTAGATPTSSVPSQLKNIERMVSGLQRRNTEAAKLAASMADRCRDDHG